MPFFEAFPRGGFVRGEGSDVAEAERKAYDEYRRDMACDHVWGRHRPGTTTAYLNGGAFCRRCGGFRSNMFPEIRPFGWWRSPLSATELWHLRSIEDDAELTTLMDAKYPHRRRERLRTARILRLRFDLLGCDDADTDPL